MMHIFSAVFLGIATNLDNFMIGLSVGLEGKRISFFSNLAIALSSALAGLLSGYLASLCTGLGRWPGYAGGGLLILLGLWPLLFAKGQERAPQKKEQRDYAAYIGVRKTLVLGVALAVNCVAAAFGAGMTGVAPAVGAGMIGLGSFLAVGLGALLGRATSAKVRGGWLEKVSAGMMILIGILELFI